jgi:tetratricopeptide (TPR) repeat protein
MTISRKALFMIAGIVICFGCSGTGFNLLKTDPGEGEQKPSAEVQKQGEGEMKLSAGIQYYEEGNYKESAKLLQEALKKGLSDKTDQIKAHKYLAFIHCVSGRKKECTNEFKKALALDPNFELKPAEAEHPLWGPVYRSVKGNKATPGRK